MSASRQLAIKTGVVTRLVKEVQSYKNEATMLGDRVRNMEAEGQDEYEVRQQKRVHADSLQMIPDSEKRLAKAIEELQELVGQNEDLAGMEELAKAKAALEAAVDASA